MGRRDAAKSAVMFGFDANGEAVVTAAAWERETAMAKKTTTPSL